MKITLIGSGKLGTHLYKAFATNEKIQLIQWVNRSSKKQKTKEGIPLNKQWNPNLKSDLILLAVSDQSISSISKSLPKESFVVHTSGGISIDALIQKRRGVFYPIQTFSEGRTVDFLKLPIGIEAENSQDLKNLNELVKSIDASAVEINSEKRQHLHLAAVLVNNFSNHLFFEAAKLCEENQIDFRLLLPLMLETVEKLKSLEPQEAQTGPALRRDQETIDHHLKLIKNSQLKELYSLMTSAIQKNHDQ